MFADKGKSGATGRRPAFETMIDQCLQGKIDYVLVKSVDRFSKDALEIITLTRELKARSVGVRFEQEGIDTLVDENEFYLILHASFAQMQSESMSRNISLSIRSGYQRGSFTFPSCLYGYQLSIDGEITPHPKEAEAVRLVYELWLTGSSIYSIRETLEAKGFKRKNGQTKWSSNMVYRILTNEKYAGDSLLQKSYTPSLFAKARINNGELAQYYIKDSHPAIITREQFQKVQAILAKNKRRTDGKRYSRKYLLSNILVCGECGDRLYRVIRESGTVVWSCKKRVKYGKKGCPNAPFLKEKELHQQLQIKFGLNIDQIEDFGLNNLSIVVGRDLSLYLMGNCSVRNSGNKLS